MLNDQQLLVLGWLMAQDEAVPATWRENNTLLQLRKKGLVASEVQQVAKSIAPNGWRCLWTITIAGKTALANRGT